MASKNSSAEEFASRAFWITIAGTLAYVASVFLFVLSR
jgi:hypothetical protein